MKHLSKLGRNALMGLLIAAGLAACGGSDDHDASQGVIVAGADTLTINVGANANLLANDTLGDTAATTGAAGNVTFAIVTGTPPAGVVVTDGTVAVGATAIPGAFSLTYQICETASSENCATTEVQITVPAPAIVAVADTFTLASDATGDLLANDTLGSAPATSATVITTAIGTLPAGITVPATGVVIVGNTAVAGTYPIEYRICQVAAPTNCATATVTVTVPTVTMLAGRAVDSATGQGVPGVTVTAGGATATTGANGDFTMANAPVGARVTVLFRSATHAESARIADLRATGNPDLQVRLVKVAVSAAIDIATGGTVTVPGSTAQVTLPANAVQRADGSLPTGNMTVAVTPIDPASDSSVMPGDFTTVVAGAARPIESFGALNVQLTDAAGAALNLRAGQTATLRIPVASRNADVPSSIPLFFFDNASGRWLQEGTATRAGAGSADYYEGTVTHFTTWNADQVYNTVLVTGCVVDAAGLRIADAYVGSDGISYTGTSSVRTDAGGNFVLPIRTDSLATVLSQSGGKLTNTLRVGPYAADATLPACLFLSQAGAGITMKLTWGETPSDLDSHLYAPNGSHVYFSSKGNLLAVPFANLDVDDVGSYGPEVVTLTRLMVGTYKYSVNNYSGQGDGAIGASGARVELNIPGRAAELFAPPVSGETTSTDWWNLFELDVDAACVVTVRRVQAFSTVAPTAATAPPVYCTPS